MEKYDWKKDLELRILLMDSAPAPVAVKGPKFDSQYKFFIKTEHGVTTKSFVPDWALPVVCRMLDSDKTVQSYWYIQTFKGR